MLGNHLDARRGRQQLSLPAGQPGARVRVREDAAEVRVAALRLAQQRHVCPSVQADLSAGDRANTEVLRRDRKLERAVHTVVIGQRKRVVPELRRARRQLLRQ